MAEVVLDSVSRVYPGGRSGQDTVALDSLSLDLRDRELLVLLGPSGCGKTTTLRLIAGLEELTSGQIRIAGRDVRNVSPRDRDVALVFQDYALYPHLTVRGNLAFGLRMRYGASRLAGWLRRVIGPRLGENQAATRNGIDAEVEFAARSLGIEALLERTPKQLSGGERQRVALGRAIVRHPAVFLFDEPLSNLDAKLRVRMRGEIKELHDRLGATMIYVTHDQIEALTLGDRIAVLDGGRLQQVGTPQEVYDRPRNRFVAGFLGTPPMNFVSGELVGGEASGQNALAFRAAGIELKLDAVMWPGGRKSQGLKNGRSLILGIRPTDVSLVENTNSGDVVPGVVKRVEFVGDASLVHVRLGTSQESCGESEVVVSKVEPITKIKSGQPVGIQFNLARSHWFDPATGLNLATEN